MVSRLFIIFKDYEAHCTCVPIYTYEDQGCTKRGGKPGEHGIIYVDSPDNFPLPLPGEPQLGFSPVRGVVSTVGAQLINSASRVNYAKVDTVEHHAQIDIIGSIFLEDWNVEKNAVRSFFE